jgi:AraC-like DNA-binding protein
VEALRYIIFLYCFLGIFIAGGLFFKNRSPANITLSVFIFLFTLEQLDFLYTTSKLVIIYPEYYLFIYPVCLLFGPALWLHFRFVQYPRSNFRAYDLLHLLPFVLFVIFLLLPILKLDGQARIDFTRVNFINHMMPLNYIRTSHVTFYGLLMVFVIFKDKIYQNRQSGMYLSVIAVIYFLTAVFQSYLTRFADNYRQFVLYFFLASTIVLIAGFVLYVYPEILQQFQKKYFSSNLKSSDRIRIIDKVKNKKQDISLFLNSSLSLNDFCNLINERPHHVSQVFSEDFSTSFSNYVNEQRINYAKSLLSDAEHDDLKILAIAFESGFNNNVTFNKAFVKFTGLTPGKYRKESKKK